MTVHLSCHRFQSPHAKAVEYVAGLLARASGMDAPPNAEHNVALAYVPQGANPAAIIPPGSVDLAIIIPEGPFFTTSLMKSAALPENPATLLKALSDDGFDALCEFRQGTITLKFDLIAAAFWFLTRHEEYVNTERDVHGRFLSSQSSAPPELYDKPVVNLWALQLARRVSQALGIEKQWDPRFVNVTTCLTHDVDLLRKYRGLLGGVRRTMGAAIRGGLSNALREAREAAGVKLSGKRDPYDSFADLFSAKERMDIPSTWFFQAGGGTEFDCDYDLHEREPRQIIAEALAQGDEIALHPSYLGGTSTVGMERELALLRGTVGDKATINGARMHYLRWNFPDSPQIMSNVGLVWDASLGFPDRNGFRCGWSGPFRVFDCSTMQILPLIEVPLVAMDVTLAVYEKVSAEHSLERLSALLDNAHVPGGVFTFLWHNTLKDENYYGPYWATFEYFLYAGGSSMSFRTVSEVVGEFMRSESIYRGRPA